MQFHKLLSTHYEAMPSVLLRLSVFSCLQLNRNDRLRRCRRNRMSLCVCFRVYYIYTSCSLINRIASFTVKGLAPTTCGSYVQRNSPIK